MKDELKVTSTGSGQMKQGKPVTVIRELGNCPAGYWNWQIRTKPPPPLLTAIMSLVKRNGPPVTSGAQGLGGSGWLTASHARE
jgi:hypothetical protein